MLGNVKGCASLVDGRKKSVENRSQSFDKKRTHEETIYFGQSSGLHQTLCVILEIKLYVTSQPPSHEPVTVG